jgi:hypothetical protein
MSYAYDKFKSLDNAVSRDRLIFQQIMNARLGGMCIVLTDASEFQQLDPKNDNTLYLVAIDDSTMHLYKGSVRIRLDNVVAEYDHAIITRAY